MESGILTPALALQARIDAVTNSSRNLHLYDSLGFLSNDVETESVSKTAEYSYDARCKA
ncbi:MAG: hypothetical protein NZM65_07095 [Flavobacteriales bacterium]|nr:hypothetical protein [Flavobacteriales bacterium]MDW8410439.1 hypothetical protein [Flavobacteriales bacterium]